MEQPCYKCGQLVEEGVAFCPHCSAPQIRVVIAEPAPVPAGFADAAAIPQGSDVLPAPRTTPDIPFQIQWSRTLRPCALAALIASLLMVLGLNPFVAMLSVGFLAVVFYRQLQERTPVRAVDGARLGALGGLLWFVLSAILQGTAVFVLRQGPEMHDQVLKKIQQTAQTVPNDPQVQALLDYMKTPSGFMAMIVLAFIFAFFAALILGTLGGALAGAVLGRRDKP